MTDALIGHTGFVGTTLCLQRSFDALFRSTNIGEISGRSFDTVVCAGAPAQKWIANKEPDADKRKLAELMKQISTIQAGLFVLISTVDVFQLPVGVSEQTPVQTEGLHPYGLHRRELERFVEKNFERHLILRLPGLVGPGLRKNVIYDFLNDNNLEAIESRSVFQFYPMVNLWSDITKALSLGLKLLHLTAEPVSVLELAREGFSKNFDQQLAAQPARYDVLSVHAPQMGGSNKYQYNKRETFLAVRAYAQSEQLVRGIAGAGR